MNKITAARKKKAAATPPVPEAPAAPEPVQTPARTKVPRVSAPYVPFPVDALPGRIGEFVAEVSDVMGCDPVNVAGPCMAIAGGLIGNARFVQLKTTWREAPIIWAVTVADSSSTKSPAYRLVEAPLVALQIKLNQSFGQKRDLFVSDCTIEALGVRLHENPRGMLLAMDELTSWFGSFTRYRKTGSDSAGWCQLWQCGTLKKDRVVADTPSVIVPNACCSVTGTITPGNLASVFATPGLFETGLLFRMLYAMPPGRNEPWHEREVSKRALASWSDCCDKLLTIEGQHSLLLSADAKKLWVEHFDSTSKKIDMAPFIVRAALVKLRAYVARFALLHFLMGCHEVDNGLGAIPGASMAAGIKLANWYADEANRVYMLRGESEDARDLRGLADSIAARPGGRITVTKLQQSSHRYPTSEAALAVLESLVDAGFGEIVKEGKSTVFVRTGLLPITGPAPVASEEAEEPLTVHDTCMIVAAKAAPEIVAAEAVPTPSEVRANTPVSRLDIDDETRFALIRAGLKTVGDLMEIDYDPAVDNPSEAVAKLAGITMQAAIRVGMAVETNNYARSPTCSGCGRNVGIDSRERLTCLTCQAQAEPPTETLPFKQRTNGRKRASQ